MPTGDEEGLVGYWNFNEGEGNILTDLTGNEMMALYMVQHGVVDAPTDGPLVIDSFDEGLSEDLYLYDFNNSEGYLSPAASEFENAQCVKIDLQCT